PIAREQIRDPVGELYYPYAKGRDPCRTPMPWQAAAPNLGFTSGTPWLPLAPAHRTLSVDAQDADPQSALTFARRAIAERKKHGALTLGTFVPLPSTGQILAFERHSGGERIICAFNLTRSPASIALSARPNHLRLHAFECGGGHIEASALRLEPL